MSDICIYLKMEPYLSEWVYCHFGNPVKLLKEGIESNLMKRMLSEIPEGARPDTEKDGNVKVVIPYYKEKDPRTFNYLSPRAKNALVESFENLFKINLFSELGTLDNIKCNKTTVIYSYCEKHKISEEHWETIRQKYYRIRKRYFKEKKLKLAI